MMEISNFKLVDVIGVSPITWKFKAVVTVTTKRLFRRAIVEKREIFKSYAGSWYFIDSGDYVPSEINKLERSLEALKGKDLPECLNT